MTSQDQQPAEVGDVGLGAPSRRVDALIVEGEVHESDSFLGFDDPFAVRLSRLIARPERPAGFIPSVG